MYQHAQGIVENISLQIASYYYSLDIRSIMDRKTIEITVCATLLAGGLGMLAATPWWLKIGGALLSTICVRRLFLHWRTAPTKQRDNMSQDKKAGPQGTAGIWIEGCSNVRTSDNIIRGFDNGIVDINGIGNTHTGNQISNIGTQKPTPNGERPSPEE